MSFTRDNHYVPRLYLKNFANNEGMLRRYRILVSKDKVPLWKSMNVGGVAYQTNLYTRTLPHGESDEIEKWLNADFETPAEASLSKIVNNERLSREDYRLLVRFAAAQCVRTPAFLIENLPRWRKETEKILEDTGRRIQQRLKHGLPISKSEEWDSTTAPYYPIRVTKEPSLDGKSTIFKTETVVGRATWIYGMRHLLTKTIDRFDTQRWTILSADDDLPWFTSDDPVIRLNFRNANDYDFKGGWGVSKTNIILPLSPKHLLITQIGERPLLRGTVLPRSQAMMIRKMIAEHAHRYIFSFADDQAIPRYRPRHVDAQAVRNEEAEWQKWHAEQSAAEKELLRDPPTGVR